MDGRKSEIIDSSFLIALTDESDNFYNEAQSWFKENLKSFLFLTHNFVLCETITRLRRRAGFKLTREFGDKFRHSNLIKIEWIDAPIEKKAWELFQKYADKENLSYVDCLSFAYMKDNKISHALTFDKHFKQVGFISLP